ncbi:unnamed protein product [Brassicogethes aeneus]|uniref:Uncharacterized protein n=1 Tax=Brassicogethes aeneus TaxID=1431903 RepID=A0A9P0FM97_BRAAE|nr:unnamed protein product [Brassicogethes aeneus]
MKHLSAENTKKVFYTLKNLSDTRWSCRADAVKALVHGYKSILNALTEICNDAGQKDIVKCQARSLYQNMSRLETSIYTQFWHEILEGFGSTIRYLQNSTMILSTALNLLKSLTSFVESKRDAFDSYETAGKELSDVQEYQNSRVRSLNVPLKPIDYGKASAVQLSPKEKFRTESFLPVIDRLIVSLRERMSAYQVANERFGFFAEISTMKNSELTLAAKKLVHFLSSRFGS